MSDQDPKKKRLKSSKSSKKPDEALVQRLVSSCQNGDVESFGQIYDLFIDAIYRYVYYRVDRDEVEDVVEDIFVRTWENIDKYVPGEHPFSSWLFRIAHNMVVDHYRSFRRHVSLRQRLPKHINQSEDDPVEWANQQLSHKFLRQALHELKDVYQQVLVLKYLNGFSNQEIAVIMQRKVGNVRILQYRALRALRDLLKQKGFSRNE